MRGPERRWKPYQKFKNAQDMRNMDEYNDSAIVLAAKKIWFLNNELVRVHHTDRGAGMLTLWNYPQEKFVGILIDEWVKKRKRAYSIRATGLLLNRNPTYLSQLATKKMIFPASNTHPEGKRKVGNRCYYSEDDVYELRDFFASRHWGAKRKDGRVTNNTTPTVQELNRKMGVGILQYTKNNDGEIVPIWSESI